MTRRNMLIWPLAGAAAALGWPKLFTEAEVTRIALASRSNVKFVYGEPDRSGHRELQEVRLMGKGGSVRLVRGSSGRFARVS
jgi:hypothetical protein